MSLLATLPAATRGHLGSANNSLARATEGLIQPAATPPRRGGGLFTPPIETEMFRRITAVCTVLVDSRTALQNNAPGETRFQPKGAIAFTGATSWTTQEPKQAPVQVAPLATVADATPAINPPMKPVREARPPQPPIPATPQTEPSETRIRAGGAFVLSVEARIRTAPAPTPTRALTAGMGLRIDGQTRFHIGAAPSNEDDLVTILALLAQEKL